MSDKNYFIELNGEKHRLLVIEYFDDKPHSVITEKYWDHSKEPWFRAGKDMPSGTSCCDFDFNYSKKYDTIYWHNSGGGGKKSQHAVGRLIGVNGKIWVALDVELTKYVQSGDSWVHGKITPVEIAEYGYTVLDEPINKSLENYRGGESSINPFALAEGDTECVYCPRCESYLPDDYNIMSGLCEHAQWCDDCSSWVLDDTKELIDGDGKCEHESSEEE